MRLSAVALGAPSALLLLAAFDGFDVFAADAGAHYGLRLEAGAEFDSNPTRRETIAGAGVAAPLAPSPATRVALSGDAEARLGSQVSLSIMGGLAGRRLLRAEAQGEDLMVGNANVALAYVERGWSLAAVGAIYDVAQRADSIDEARDFRSLSAGARALFQRGDHRVFAAAGGRWFVFKPDATFDFIAPTAAVGYRHVPRFRLDGGAEWEYGLQAAFESRLYEERVCASTGCDAAAPMRRDRFVTLDVDVTRTADQLIGFGLSLHHNDSPRFGESLSRLLGHVRLVLPLPWEFSLAGRGELVATRYADPVPVGHDVQNNAFITIEDEGRSSLKVDLSRPFGDWVEAGLRYTLFSQTPGSGPVGFRRHVAFAYVAFALGR